MKKLSESPCLASTHSVLGSRGIRSTLIAGSIAATMALAGCGGGGGSSGGNGTSGTPAPTVTLSASPTTVSGGGSSTLNWSSTNATSCTSSGGSWTGSKGTSGSSSTGALNATTKYTLTCTGAGGSASASATVSVSPTVVSGQVSVTPKLATLTTSQKQQFTATVPGNASAKWSVDGVAGGNSDSGTISATGLYTPGSIVGTHTIVATSAVSASQTGAATAAVTGLDGIYTRHTDNARTGANLQEYALTPTLVATRGSFGKVWSCTNLDGQMYAQPLYVANLSINGGVHNVIFLATEHDSIYAIDADATNCTQYWKASFVNGTSVIPAPAGTLYQSTNPLDWDISPEVGITGTPVVSRSQNELFVVAKTQETDQSGTTTYHDRLHALNLATGAEASGSPVDITATYPTNAGGTVTFTPEIQNQRPALLLTSYSGGTAVYITYASYSDLGAYNGWIIAYNTSTLSQVAVWNDTPNGVKGGIWISDGGLAVDSSGSLFLSTGNGTFDDTSDVLPPAAPQNDFGETFVKLDPSSLAVTDFYAPSQTALWTTEDEDLAASGVTVLPDNYGPSGTPNMLVGSDKQGHLWLINRQAMSQYAANIDNTIQYLTMPSISGCNLNCIFGTPTFYNNTVYFGMVNTSVMAFTLTGGLFAFDASTMIAIPSSTSAETYGYPGTTAVVSASDTGDGIVWVLDSSNNGTATNGPPTNAGPMILRAYDASNLGTTLYSSATLAGDAAADAVKFQEPVVANGHVYVGGQYELSVYGPK
jgi:hypothetical protein